MHDDGTQPLDSVGQSVHASCPSGVIWRQPKLREPVRRSTRISQPRGTQLRQRTLLIVYAIFCIFANRVPAAVCGHVCLRARNDLARICAS